MATASNPVTAAQPGIVSTFLKAHERIILVIIIGVLFWGLSSKVLGYLASHDQTVATKAQAVLQSQLQANQEALTAEKQQTDRYAQLASQIAQSNQTIKAASQQRQLATQQQVKTDSTFQPADLAARWNLLTKTDSSSIMPGAADYTVTPSMALTTVQDLETIPQLTADLAGEKQTVQNQTQLVTSLASVNTSLTAQVTGLNQTVTDETKACIAQVNLVKVEARKSKLKWFGVGFVSGYIGGLLTKGVL